MPLEDLDAIQKKVNDSRAEFLAALDSYERKCSNDGKDISEKYLHKQTLPDPDFADASREQAKETIALLRAFGNIRVSVTMDVALINKRMEATILMLHVAILGEATNAMTGQSLDAFKKAVESGTKDAVSIGEAVVKVHIIGASVLLLRQATLEGFRAKYIERSIYDQFVRLREELKSMSKSEAVSKGLSVAIDGALHTLNIAADTSLLVKVIKGGWKAYESVKPREPEIQKGSTDAMQLLCQQLKAEGAVFEQLKVVCQEAHAEFDRVMKSIP
jgi:hypothetical protein